MTRPALMSGVQLGAHGSPEALVWRDDIPVPRPGAGEVLLRVLAAGVNMTGANNRPVWQGKEGRPAWSGEMAFPRIQSSNLCGRVVALGQGVQGLRLGARVICPANPLEPTTDNRIALVAIGTEIDGAFAQYCLVKARHLQDTAALPACVEPDAMPSAHLTAHNLLTRARVAVGERVLVTGASGGLGLAAVHLALLRGALVTGQCPLAKSASVRALGADILDRSTALKPRSFDVVIDVIGGDAVEERLAALRPGGRYATPGAVGGPLVKGDLRSIYLNDLVPQGASHQPREVFAGLVTVISTARIRPVVSQSYPLRDMARAQKELVAGRHPGQLALVTDGAAP